ncbi:hypothetical protein J3Q09_12735 [Pseudomonas sp. R4-83]|uniref:hypothetical protein n=1 Tax=Pseudomonas TaxID=286 RepID=UPI002FCC584C
MDDDDQQHTCTRCSRLYKSPQQAERYKAGAGHAGLCGRCIKLQQEQAIDEGLALCAAKMMLIDSQFKTPPKR